MKISVPYKLRRALALGAIACGTLVGCTKKNTTPDITPTTTTRDIKLVFTTSFKTIELEKIKKCADMPDVHYIYMVPYELGWDCLKESNIHSIRNYLQQCIDINPNKVHGKGTFRFKRGEPSKNIADSLWFVQNGWSINQKQK